MGVPGGHVQHEGLRTHGARLRDASLRGPRTLREVALQGLGKGRRRSDWPLALRVPALPQAALMDNLSDDAARLVGAPGPFDDEDWQLGEELLLQHLDAPELAVLHVLQHPPSQLLLLLHPPARFPQCIGSSLVGDHTRAGLGLGGPSGRGGVAGGGGRRGLLAGWVSGSAALVGAAPGGRGRSGLPCPQPWDGEGPPPWGEGWPGMPLSSTSPPAGRSSAVMKRLTSRRSCTSSSNCATTTSGFRDSEHPDDTETKDATEMDREQLPLLEVMVLGSVGSPSVRYARLLGSRYTFGGRRLGRLASDLMCRPVGTRCMRSGSSRHAGGNSCMGQGHRRKKIDTQKHTHTYTYTHTHIHTHSLTHSLRHSLTNAPCI